MPAAEPQGEAKKSYRLLTIEGAPAQELRDKTHDRRTEDRCTSRGSQPAWHGRPGCLWRKEACRLETQRTWHTTLQEDLGIHTADGPAYTPRVGLTAGGES